MSTLFQGRMAEQLQHSEALSIIFYLITQLEQWKPITKGLSMTLSINKFIFLLKKSLNNNLKMQLNLKDKVIT